MKSSIWIAVLLLGSLAAAQQQQPPMQQDPGSSGQTSPTPPGSTPPTFPTGKTPADKPKRSAEEDARMRVKTEREIEKTIGEDSRLRGAEVKATVNAENIVVSGTVLDEAQRRLALHMAEAYSSGREIIDKLTVARK